MTLHFGSTNARAAPPARARGRGFTLIELLVTLALLSLLAALAVPLVQTQVQRQKELELRRALWEIRDAVDAYKRAAEQGRVPVKTGQTGYPPTLALLVEGVEDRTDPKRRRLFFLRRVPRDPFVDDPSLSDEDTWMKRSYQSGPEAPEPGDDVYDVSSGSALTGLNGIPAGAMVRRPVRRARGFTLIELLVVLAIVALLSAIAVPRYYAQLDAAKETVLRENLRTIRQTLDRFYGDRGRYPERLEELVETRYLLTLPLDPMTESSATWVLEPVPQGYQGAVFNVRSGSPLRARDGTAFSEW